MKKIIVFIILLAAVDSAVAIATDTEQAILNPDFHTLTVEKEGDFYAPPVITLMGNDRITVSFDEIADDFSRLQFRLIHCNADWQPSRLVESEFVDSFNVDDIEDFAFSSNTFTNYVNYRFTIPSERIIPIASGNYLAEVFFQDDPDDVVLRARFQVSEDSALVTGHSTPRTDRGFNSEWQQLVLNVDAGREQVNPYNDLLITVTQNRRPDTQRTVSNPLRVEGSMIVYDHNPQLIFPASNEYRRFETVRADYPGMGIEEIDFSDRQYNAWLKTDYGRAQRDYLFDKTQFGRFKIDEYNASDPDLGADYINVHFTLDFPEVMNGDIYLDGDFTNHTLSDEYRLRYDPENRLYYLSLPLKQGSYNYQYVAVNNNQKNALPTTSLVEGDKYETANEYNVSVFYRPPINRADRLIGTATIYSMP